MTRFWRSSLLVVSVSVTAAQLAAQRMSFVTYSGFPTGAGHVDGRGSVARFNQPRGVAAAPDGTLYVVEAVGSIIRRIAPDGTVTTIAGAANIPGTTDGPGPNARFRNPESIARDNQGNLYIADTGNHTVRKITPAGMVSTLAGAATITGSSDGSGSVARFNFPRSITSDGMMLYVADTSNHTIRKVTLAGEVTTLGGTAGASGSTDGSGPAARFNRPSAMAVDGAGDVYVADTSNHTIRKVSRDGVVTTFAGVAGSSGTIDGPISSARFFSPAGLAIDAAGSLFVTENSKNHIRRLSGGAVSRYAGRETERGSADGAALTVALFDGPDEMAVDANGNLYVADFNNHTIRKVDTGQNVTTVAGKASSSVDGMVSAAEFIAPSSLARDTGGNLYIADAHGIRRIDSTGIVTTFVGNPARSGNSPGQGMAAGFFSIQSIAIDGSGNLFATSYNDKIWKITPNGTASVYAGTGQRGGADGPALSAQFNLPSGIAIDAAGNVLVADTGSRTIRRITPSGAVTTLAGVAGVSGMEDGTGAAARFNFPGRMVIDPAGNLYLADSARIRKVTPSGVVTTIAISNGIISGIALTESGEIFISQTDTIRRLRADGTFEIVGGVFGPAGVAPRGGFADGIATAAQFDSPAGLLWAGSRLYIADSGNNAIRIGYYAQPRRRAARP